MDYILNILIAGWCADAAGARLEFRKTRYSQTDASNAMHFTGESTTDVCIGQITDDSELEIALLSGIMESYGDGYFPLDRIAEKYIEWFRSEPFDIGYTTRMALEDATNETTMMQNAEEFNSASESNGSLMRSGGLAVCCWNKSDEIIMKVAEMDARLTHPSPVIHQSTRIYCILIATMLRNHIQTLPQTKTELLNIIKTYATNPTVKLWLAEGLKLTSLDTYNALEMCGHAKHAFVMMVYFLNHIEIYDYEKAVLETLMCGGDTDTNAKIVGNVLGAYYEDCVPKYMIDPVLEFDCMMVKSDTYYRPRQYSVIRFIELLRKQKQMFDLV